MKHAERAVLSVWLFIANSISSQFCAQPSWIDSGLYVVNSAICPKHYLLQALCLPRSAIPNIFIPYQKMVILDHEPYDELNLIDYSFIQIFIQGETLAPNSVIGTKTVSASLSQTGLLPNEWIGEKNNCSVIATGEEV